MQVKEALFSEMRNKLLFGRSIDTGSWIHKLDPRAKITGMVLYLIAMLLVRTWIPLGIAVVFSILYMKATKIPLRYFIKAAKPLWVLIVFIFVIQTLTMSGEHILLQLGSFKIYTEGASAGLISAIRMTLLVSFTAILTFTTTPGILNQGLNGVLRPLQKIGVPSDRLTLMLGISLRFIPTILDETQKIMMAQAARGADLKELPWKEKGKLLISLLVPVTVGAFRRAEDLVLSMESRGYIVGRPRSEYHRLHWGSRETWFTISYILLIAIVILVGLYV